MHNPPDCGFLSILGTLPENGKHDANNSSILQASLFTLPERSDLQGTGLNVFANLPCCPLWGWCDAQRIEIAMIASGNHTSVLCRNSGTGGVVGDFELLPFIEQHPLCDSLRAA